MLMTKIDKRGRSIGCFDLCKLIGNDDKRIMIFYTRIRRNIYFKTLVFGKSNREPIVPSETCVYVRSKLAVTIYTRNSNPYTRFWWSKLFIGV